MAGKVPLSQPTTTRLIVTYLAQKRYPVEDNS